ncbi:MAG: T9SS type A sorting domain-containing protein, partial [Paludibacter sp.]|nr:T9SS type A sorting domain-containing protein [Paludibacter sp.]
EPSSWSEISIGNYGNSNGASQVVCTSGIDRVVGYNNGTTNINPGAPGNYNFKIQALGRMQYTGGSFNVNDGTEVTATFTITSSMTDNFRSKSNGSWSIASSWESSANGINWTTSTLTPGSSASSITILNGHNITLDGDVTMPSLSINSDATFTASDATARTLTITKSTSGPTTTLSNSGTWANGTGGSTVVFTGAPSLGDAIHAITGTIPFQKVIINKTGGYSNVGASFATNCSVSQSLEIGTGGFVSTDPPASFYGSNAVLKFNQGTDANYEINPGDKTWSTTVIPKSITINSGTVTVKEDRTASGTVIIDNGATLVINATRKLTVSTLTNSGTITNNGTLTLKTGNTNPPTLLNNNSMSESGVYEVEQSLTSGRQWWYLSSPLSAAYTGTVFSGSQVGIYDEDAFNYTAPFASSTLMSVGLGHVIKFPNTDARTITFTGGSLNNGDITITPTRTGTSNAKRGFNLIGNPYPSYIDWDAIYNDATNPATNMRDAIWFRTYSSGMTFHTYSDGDAVPTTSGVTGKIAPMQGFWVKVHADGTNGSLTFKNAHRSHKAETGYNPLKVKTADDRQRVRLVLSDGTNSDETLIVGKSYASDSQDAYDIEKMSNESAQISEIYSMIGTETMVINSVAPITAGKTVALGIRATSEKAYSITASQLQNIPTDVRVVLVDAEDESETELSEGVSYNFVTPAGAVNNRFSIQFRSPGATTLVDNDSKNKILVYSNSQQQIEIISTESLPAGTQIRVFNAAGQTIAQMQAAGNRISIPASISKGVYFCHIENTNQNLQYKVIVR